MKKTFREIRNDIMSAQPNQDIIVSIKLLQALVTGNVYEDEVFEAPDLRTQFVSVDFIAPSYSWGLLGDVARRHSTTKAGLIKSQLVHMMPQAGIEPAPLPEFNVFPGRNVKTKITMAPSVLEILDFFSNKNDMNRSEVLRTIINMILSDAGLLPP